VVWHSATRWGSRDAVLVATRVLAVVYGLLVPLQLVVLHGTARVVTVSLAAVSCLVFAAGARVALLVGDQTVDRLLLLVCALPLVNALAHLAVTRQMQQTTVLLLVVVGIGAVSNGRPTAWALDAVACLGWVAVVLLAGPEPRSSVPFYVFLLVLAVVLSVAVLEIRLTAYRRLTRAMSRSDLGLRRFRSLFDHSTVGIGLVDEDGRFVEANPALCELLARPAAEVIGHAATEFAHPDDLPQERFGAAGPDAPVSERLETRFVRPDGEPRWAWVSFAGVPGPQGQTWTVAHLHDVTERRVAEDELRLSQRSMAAAVEIAQATQQGLDPRPVVLRHLRRLAGASFVSLIEPLGDDRLVVTAVDGEVHLVGLSMDRHEPSVTTHVWHSGESVFASQVTEHPQVNRRLLDESGAASLMWQPVGVPGDLQAVLSIAWDDPLPGVDTAGRAAVEAVAAEAGAALTGERLRRVLERSTVTDSLTGLLNRRGWDLEIQKLQHQADRTGTPFTLALVDLDHFKRFNDTFGHLAGDEALRTFAERAQRALRVVDVMARWGGEEFTVALQGTSGEPAETALARLRACAPDGLTCSVGYVDVLPGGSVHQALSLADAALYRAKEEGRDRVVHGGSLPADLAGHLA
jgi:diguanylate cyclase (GGDEF)-like protein/PAS domain S-box-containing protein